MMHGQKNVTLHLKDACSRVRTWKGRLQHITYELYFVSTPANDFNKSVPKRFLNFLLKKKTLYIFLNVKPKTDMKKSTIFWDIYCLSCGSNSLPAFRGNQSVPSLRVKESKKIS
jgi:hypothetical protein